MEALPLSKENLMDHEYIPVGPLLPLAILIGGVPTQQTVNQPEAQQEAHK
jgi:hypothetical protein